MIEVFGADSIRLAEPVGIDYTGYRATIAPLARRPVNVNVAPAAVLEALSSTPALYGSSNRITRDEARGSSRSCASSASLRGPRGFPAAHRAAVGGRQALPKDAAVKPIVLAKPDRHADRRRRRAALYANALNAKRLAPLLLDHAAVVRLARRVLDPCARGGQRAVGDAALERPVREEVAGSSPKGADRLVVAQEDFEEAARLGGDSPFWATGPNSTSPFDPAGRRLRDCSRTGARGRTSLTCRAHAGRPR